MDHFTAFVSWPSAPLSKRLVLDALGSLTPLPAVQNTLPNSSTRQILQWAAYDALDPDLTFSHDPASKVLSSSYVIRKALIRKHFLSRCIHNYLTKHPSSVLRRGVPRTWELELSFADELDELWSDDLYDLSEEIEKGDASKWWILKPGMTDRGMGLRLFHTKEDLEAIFQDFEQDESDAEDVDGCEDGRDTAVITSQLRHFVIQEYLGNPLLLDPAEAPLNDAPKPSASDLHGHKFHLRVYCVASGALKIYVYERILALFSAVSYAPPSKSTDTEHGASGIDLAAHLTNTSLQTERGETVVRLLDELVGCHVLSAAPMLRQRQSARPPFAMGQALDSEAMRAERRQQPQYPTLTAEDIVDLKNQISAVLAETFKAAVGMSVHFQPLPNAFELYGIDFVITHDSSSEVPQKLQVKLLEVNSEPAIELTGPRLTWVLEDLFRSIAKTCVEPFFSSKESLARSEVETWKTGDTKENLRKCLDLQIRSTW